MGDFLSAIYSVTIQESKGQVYSHVAGPFPFLEGGGGKGLAHQIHPEARETHTMNLSEIPPGSHFYSSLALVYGWLTHRITLGVNKSDCHMMKF